MITFIQPPVASIKPTILEKHGDVRTDNYFWLNDRENPEVISYLKAENDYYMAATASTHTFQIDLFHEMKVRIKEDDESVPYLYNGYYYITRFEAGKDYPIYSRKKGSLESKEEILFDCNQMAKEHKYFQLSGLSISEDNQFATFALDLVGRRIYTIHVKNLVTEEVFPDAIENVTGNSAWAHDNKTIFYSRQDEKTLRADSVYRHKIGSDPATDVLVYFEKDDTFDVAVHKEKSKEYILIGSTST